MVPPGRWGRAAGGRPDRDATVRTVTSTGRFRIVLAAAAVTLAGCAQPGQLGARPLPEPVPAAAAAPGATSTTTTTASTTAPPRGPVLLGRGRIEEPVTVRNPGPAVFSVTRETLDPGASTGWIRRPGTEMSVVGSGTVTLVRARRCETTRYSAGDAVFVPDAQPHLLRNDGPAPVELVVTALLAPGVPDRQAVPARC